MTSFIGALPFPGNYATAAMGVFWDIQECGMVEFYDIPAEERNAAVVVQRIRKTIADSGHSGPLFISAYGDMTPHDFSSSGIKLNHFPAGEKYARETKILEDIVSWAAENPEPSTLMLIAGDVVPNDILMAVKLLQTKKKYKLMYIHPHHPTVVVLVASTSGRD
ncbi:unnamed protein product [Thlaspi arvense]|uniref:NYN domain-containing protein n=1 Tax=Thlaspi arvense TaxID=13288 RepID=A0AAU9SY52_THLAR|nr:unnamed protein product [Thlaspi arvense]